MKLGLLMAFVTVLTVRPQNYNGDSEMSSRQAGPRGVPEYRDGEGSEYGWHSQWRPKQNRWDRDYGWHYGGLDYTPEADQELDGSTAVQGRSLSGTVDRIRRLTLRDRQTQGRAAHDVAQVRLRDGRWVLVDLGPAQGREFSVNQGDRLAVRGKVGRINGRRVLFAETARVDGRTHRVARNARQTSSQAQTRQERLVTGRVTQLAPVTVRNAAGQVRVLTRMTLADGNTLVVDLGTGVQPAELGLYRGGTVRIRGNTATIGGRETLRARQITINGITTTLRNGSGRT